MRSRIKKFFSMMFTYTNFIDSNFIGEFYSIN